MPKPAIALEKAFNSGLLSPYTKIRIGRHTHYLRAFCDPAQAEKAPTTVKREVAQKIAAVRSQLKDLSRVDLFQGIFDVLADQAIGSYHNQVTDRTYATSYRGSSIIKIPPQDAWSLALSAHEFNEDGCPKGFDEAQFKRVCATAQRNLAFYRRAGNLDIFMSESMQTESQYSRNQRILDRLLFRLQKKGMDPVYFFAPYIRETDAYLQGLEEYARIAASRVLFMIAGEGWSFGKLMELAFAKGLGIPTVFFAEDKKLYSYLLERHPQRLYRRTLSRHELRQVKSGTCERTNNLMNLFFIAAAGPDRTNIELMVGGHVANDLPTAAGCLENVLLKNVRVHHRFFDPPAGQAAGRLDLHCANCSSVLFSFPHFRRFSFSGFQGRAMLEHLVATGRMSPAAANKAAEVLEEAESLLVQWAGLESETESNQQPTDIAGLFRPYGVALLPSRRQVLLTEEADLDKVGDLCVKLLVNFRNPIGAGERIRVLNLLSQIGGEEHIELVLACLNDYFWSQGPAGEILLDFSIPLAALKTLREIGQKSDLPSLQETLKKRGPYQQQLRSFVKENDKAVGSQVTAVIQLFIKEARRTLIALKKLPYY